MIPARSNRAPATRGRSRKSVESAGAAATSCIRQMLERAWPRHRSTRCMACGIWARLMVETDHGFHRTRPFGRNCRRKPGVFPCRVHIDVDRALAGRASQTRCAFAGEI